MAERALALLGEQQYCPVTRNCEHLANECSTGEAASHQVQFILCGVSAVVLAAAASAASLPSRIAAVRDRRPLLLLFLLPLLLLLPPPLCCCAAAMSLPFYSK